MTLGIEGQCFWVAISRVSAESELFSKIYWGFRDLPNPEFCPKITFLLSFLSKTRFSKIFQPKKFHLTPADLLIKFHDFRTLVAKSEETRWASARRVSLTLPKRSRRHLRQEVANVVFRYFSRKIRSTTIQPRCVCFEKPNG